MCTMACGRLSIGCVVVAGLKEAHSLIRAEGAPLGLVLEVLEAEVAEVADEVCEVEKTRLGALLRALRIEVALGPLGTGGAPTDRPQVAPRVGFVRLREITYLSAAVGVRIASFLRRG